MSNLTFDADRVDISPNGNPNYRRIEVSVTEADVDSILQQIGAQKAVQNFNEHDLLDYIGEQACKNYFDLINKPEDE